MADETSNLLPDRVKHPTIREAWHAVMCEVGYVQKNGKIEQGVKFSFAREADFIAAIRPAMLRNGLVGPIPVSVKPSPMTRIDKGANKSPEYMVDVHAVYEILHVDSTETMRVESAGTGMDTREKAIYKALTGAYKYGLREGFQIETGDDPEKVTDDPPTNGTGTGGGTGGGTSGGYTEEDMKAAREEAYERGASAGRTWVVRGWYQDKHPDYDGREIARRLKEGELPNQEDLKLFTLWVGGAKFSTLDQEKINKILARLATDEGKKKWSEFVKICGVK